MSDLQYIQDDFKETIQQQKERFFQQYLTQKQSLSQISHKKIVQKSFLKYTPLSIQLNLSDQEAYEAESLFQFLSLHLQSLPQISHLNLNLCDNSYLGSSKENLKNLTKALSKQPQLKSLILNLENTSQYDNISLYPALFKATPHLNHLDLNLTSNHLGEFQESHSDDDDENEEENEEEIEEKEKQTLLPLSCALQSLKQLKSLKLNLFFNNLGEKPESFQNLIKGLQKIQGLNRLSLLLNSNDLGTNEDNFKALVQLLKKQSNLESLELDLGCNEIESINYIQKIIQSLPSLTNLNYLNLGLEQCFPDDIPQTTQILNKSLCQLPKLKTLSLQLGNNKLFSENNNNTNIIENLPELNSLHLGVEDTDLGIGSEDLQFLYDGLKNQQGLRYFSLNLRYDQLKNHNKNYDYLKKILQQLPLLKSLKLYLTSNFNYPEDNNIVLDSLQQGLQNKPDLSTLELDIEQFDLDSDTSKKNSLIQTLLSLKSLKCVKLELSENEEQTPIIEKTFELLKENKIEEIYLNGTKWDKA